ncbi:MAG TPA: translocation/assembly module TamB domain-containing protein, partial [Usitatibacter sp.]|nr:translocation/assembly module TamB domain-containing protein [Usitatibacter sp.]
ISASTFAGQAASGHAYVSGNRDRIASADVDVIVGEAHATAKGSFGRAGDAMEVTLHAPNISMLAKPFDVTLSGRMEATGRLTGTFASPAGEVSIKGSNLTLPSRVLVNDLQLQAKAGADPDSAIDATLDAKGVAISGDESAPTTIAETAHATLRGTRRDHRLDAEIVMDRRSTFTAAVQGGLDPAAKTLAWNGKVATFAMRGPGSFALASPATLSLSAARIELGDALLRGEWGEAHLATTRWTPRTLEFKGNTTGLSVQRITRTLRAGRMPASDLVVAGDWDIQASESFNGSINVRRVSGDLRAGDPAIALGIREFSLHAQATNGRTKATLAVTSEKIGHIEGQGSGLVVHGEKGWRFAQDSPIEGHIVARLPDLAPLQPWLGAESRLGGKVDADITFAGTGAQPRIAGTVQAAQIVVREPQTGFEIERGDVVLRMDGRALRIERLTASTPWRPSQGARDRMRRVEISADAPGTIGAEGEIDLVAHTGSLRFKADRAALTQLPSRFLAVSGEATLKADAHGTSVTASLKADAGWVGALATALPSVSDDVVVVRKSAPQPSADDTEGKEPMRIDVQLALDNHVWFQGRGLDTRLDGNLHVTGQLGTPLRGNGTIRTTSGTYKGYGQDLAIERGVLTFSGPIENPQLNVLALRKGLAVEAGVEIL